MTSFDIRLATPADGEGCARIYAPIVRDTSTSFELAPPTGSELGERIRRLLPTHPWIVAVDSDDEVLGYAYGGRHRQRHAYQWSVETSAYVASDHLRRGVGRVLYEALFDCLCLLGFANAYAGITMPNDRSVAFHRGMGFEPIGTFAEVGAKFGAWCDVSWWQRKLQRLDATELKPPRPLAPCRDEVAALLQSHYQGRSSPE